MYKTGSKFKDKMR